MGLRRLARPAVLAVLALAPLAAPAPAQDAPAPPGQTARDLVQSCQAQGRHLRHAVARQWDTELFGQIDMVECTAYLAGIADMNAVAKGVFGAGLFCFPRAGVSAEQQVRAVLAWAERHPERLAKTRRAAAVDAFAEAWPCG